MASRSLLLWCVLVASCAPVSPAEDAAPSPDAAPDSSSPDSSSPDSSSPDSSSPDSSSPDSSSLDSSSPDVAPLDSSSPDASPGDGGATRSAGCGRAATGALGSFVSRSITVNGAPREYFVRLPMGYDSSRAYPVIYQFHGCSTAAARQDNNVPVHNASTTNAIVVRGRAAANCWDAATSGPDVPYVDAMIADAEQGFCADTSRRFATGYSSGSFMTHRLACIRGALFRGVATIAGGQSGSMCTGNVGALLIHDTNDGTVNISASIQARDNHVMRNRCNASAARTPIMPAPCEQYTGCAAGLPVAWCQTSGQDHARQDALAAPAFWNFLNALPPR